MEKWLQFTQFRKISAFYLFITGLKTSLTHRLAVGVGGEGGGVRKVLGDHVVFRGEQSEESVVSNWG